MDAIGKHVLAKLEIAIRQKFGNDICNFASHDESGDYTAVMDVGDDAHVNCLIRPAFETMVLRSESTPKGMEVQELEEIGSILIEKIDGSRMTAYDGTLAIQKAVSYADIPEEEAERLIFNVVMEFVQVIVSNRSMLSGRGKAVQASDETYTTDDAEDIFGFDDISEEEVQRLIEESSQPETLMDAGLQSDPDEKEEHTIEAVKEDEPEKAPGVADLPPNNPSRDRSRKKKNRKPRENRKNNAFMEGMAAAVSGTEAPIGEKDPSIGAKAEESPREMKTDVEAGPENEDGPDMDEEILDGLLKHFEEEEAVSMTTADNNASSVPEPEVSEAPKDILDPGDDYHGSDPFGLVRGTREYKESARELIARLHDLLAGIYTPMYQTATDIYERNDALQKNERNIQIKMDALKDRQRDVDESESQILASQQALLQERRKFSEYKESVRSIISDYDVQVHLVKEQGDEIKLLKHDLAQQKQETERYKLKADELLAAQDAGAAPENAGQAELLAENKGLLAQIEALREKVDNYHQIIVVFKRCHKNWKDRETEYQQRESGYQHRETEYQEQIKKAKEISTAKRQAADAKIGKLQQQLEEAESKIGALKETASDRERETMDWKKRAEEAEAKAQKLGLELKECRKDVKSMKQRVEETEKTVQKAPEEKDVNQRASEIMEALSGIGIHADPVPGAAEMMLEAKDRGFTIAVNVALSMLYVSKEVKKPSRYSRKIDDLNKLDIRASYNAGEKEITCRCAFQKPAGVADQIQEIMDNMKDFS